MRIYCFIVVSIVVAMCFVGVAGGLAFAILTRRIRNDKS